MLNLDGARNRAGYRFPYIFRQSRYRREGVPAVRCSSSSKEKWVDGVSILQNVFLNFEVLAFTMLFLLYTIILNNISTRKKRKSKKKYLMHMSQAKMFSFIGRW